MRGMTFVTQLSSPSNYLGRVWTSLTSRAQENRDQPYSIVITPVGGVLMLVAVCKDHKVPIYILRMVIKCFDLIKLNQNMIL